jgi:hypothetical protein
MPVTGLGTAHDTRVILLDLTRDRPYVAVADATMVNGTNVHDSNGGAREENLLGGIEFAAVDRAQRSPGST